MSIHEVGYSYRCDRPDCDATISLVQPPGESTAGRLRDAGWTWSTVGRLRHFCPRHSVSRQHLVALRSVP